MSRGGYEQALTFIFISFLSRRRPYRLINNPAVAVAAVLLAESPGRDGTASLLSSDVASGRRRQISSAGVLSLFFAKRNLCFPFDPFRRVVWFDEKESKADVSSPAGGDDVAN